MSFRQDFFEGQYPVLSSWRVFSVGLMAVELDLRASAA